MRYLAWSLLLICCLAVLPAQAQDAALLDSYADCGFTKFINRENLTFGAVIVDFETGRGCVENLDRVFNAASVPKLFVAGAYYEQLYNGYISANRLEFTENYWMGGSNDCLREDDIGMRYSDEELIDLMINCSDNSATWMLMDSIGWFRIDAYVESLGLESIGPIVPYAEVDRRKLEFLDERWGDVPLGMVSRFYRGRQTEGLSRYFGTIPERPSRDEFAQINQQYFETYDSNTITPRALASYIIKLRNDIQAGGIDGLVASSIFDSMLFTQRQFSVQYLPGTVYIGAKNGFDRGLLAEANVLFSSLDNRIPSGMVLLFAQYDNLTEDNSALPGPFGGRLNDTFRELAPYIRDILYPSYREPQVNASLNISFITLNQQEAVQGCWNPYFASGFDPVQVPFLERCFRSIAPRVTFPVDENLALALVLNGLNNQDVRFVLIFTAPDGRVFSYQTDRRNVEQAAVYWFHPIDMAGVWTVDIYQNLRHVYNDQVVVQR